MKYLVIFCVAMLAACATPIETTKLSQFTHADLQNAAAIATANGYPARAAVWTSNDQLLTAWEKQIDACNQALLAAKPKSPSGTVGLATATELAAEGIGTGIPASVKLNCEPLPLPGVPVFPKIP